MCQIGYLCIATTGWPISWVGLKLICAVPPCAYFCLGWWEIGKSGLAGGSDGGWNIKVNPTQPRFARRWASLYMFNFIRNGSSLLKSLWMISITEWSWSSSCPSTRSSPTSSTSSSRGPRATAPSTTRTRATSSQTWSRRVQSPTKLRAQSISAIMATEELI